MAIKIFADGADLESITKLNDNPVIKGFTTNPTLMKKSGITDYAGFAKDVLSVVKEKPFSFEVFSDSWEDMEREADIIASWADNVYVKIPITNTKGINNFGLVKSLIKKGVKINFTCIFTYEQIGLAIHTLENNPSIISIFAGRIADAGDNPEHYVHFAIKMKEEKQEILWASTRELSNIRQAELCGADIITVGHNLLAKMDMIGMNLKELSLDTVRMFRQDAIDSGFEL